MKCQYVCYSEFADSMPNKLSSKKLRVAHL